MTRSGSFFGSGGLGVLLASTAIAAILLLSGCAHERRSSPHQSDVVGDSSNFLDVVIDASRSVVLAYSTGHDERGNPRVYRTCGAAVSPTLAIVPAIGAMESRHLYLATGRFNRSLLRIELTIVRGAEVQRVSSRDGVALLRLSGSSRFDSYFTDFDSRPIVEWEELSFVGGYNYARNGLVMNAEDQSSIEIEFSSTGDLRYGGVIVRPDGSLAGIPFRIRRLNGDMIGYDFISIGTAVEMLGAEIR